MQKIGLLTYSRLPELSADDQLLLPILKREGFTFDFVNWNTQLPEHIDCNTLWIRSPWDYFLKPQLFLSYLQDCQEQGICIINSPHIVSWNFDKFYLKDLIQWGIPTVESYFFKKNEPIDGVLKKIDQQKWSRFIIKPTISGNSHNTFLLDNNSSDLREKVMELINTGDFILQPYLNSIETEGEISLIYFNTREKIVFSHAVIKHPKKSDFRVQMEFGGSTLPFTNVPSTLHDLSQNVFSNIQQQGLNDWFYARIDIVNWQTQPAISEVEMIEPSLYFSYQRSSAETAIHCLKDYLANA